MKEDTYEEHKEKKNGHTAATPRITEPLSKDATTRILALGAVWMLQHATLCYARCSWWNLHKVHITINIILFIYQLHVIIIANAHPLPFSMHIQFHFPFSNNFYLRSVASILDQPLSYQFISSAEKISKMKKVNRQT